MKKKGITKVDVWNKDESGILFADQIQPLFLPLTWTTIARCREIKHFALRLHSRHTVSQKHSHYWNESELRLFT